MRKESLLTYRPSKITDERLWLIADSKVIRDLGHKPTPPIHPLYFEHEKAIGDIFVSLAVSGHLTEWDRDDRPSLRDDARFSIDQDTYYLEMEMGNHGADRLTEKVVRYKKYFRETGERFNVLFVMFEDANKIEHVLESERVTSHYQACLLADIVDNPAQIFGF